MLTLVEITNDRGNSLLLPFLDTSAGYVVKDIEGLDPVKATLTTSSMAQVDGVQFQNARRDERNITMNLGLEPNFAINSVQSLRAALYDYFMPKQNIKLGFYLDGVLYAVTDGQVESFANTLFSSDPEVDISILCYDPDFYGPTPQVLSDNTVSDSNFNAIDYEGTSEAGVIFVLNVDRTLTDFTLYNRQPDNTLQQFNVSGAFQAGDVLTMNSVPGSRGLTMVRDNVETSILFYVDVTSDWIAFDKGTNEFRAYASGDPVPFTLTYTPKYGGI